MKMTGTKRTIRKGTDFPLVDPVPRRRAIPSQPEPERKPVPEPAKEPEKVPA